MRIWFRWVFLTWPKCNRWGRTPAVTMFAARSNTLRWSVTRLVCGKCFSLSQLLHPSSHLFADLYKQGFPQIRDVSYFLSESWWVISSKATRTGGAQPEKIFFHGTATIRGYSELAVWSAFDFFEQKIWLEDFPSCPRWFSWNSGSVISDFVEFF